ncbi:MAG: DUF2339 domain-containing protein [Bacteroidetes bacterium]|nr:DUF2339 domain-containing protein [Bacteroidota bacterium]
MPTAYQDSQDERILNTLAALERRLQAIEERLQQPALSPEESEAVPVRPAVVRESLEFRIGRNWLPKLGIIVLAIGVAFLLTLPLSVLPAFVANTLGFLFTGVLLLLSRYWARTMIQFSRYMSGGAMLLLFFSTMRLHYFGENPVITDGTVTFVLLLLVTAVNLFLSLRAKSSYLAALSLAMGCAAVLTAPSPWLVLFGNLIMAAATVFVVLRYHWPFLLAFGIAAVTFTHFLWGINNPFFSGSAAFVAEPFAHFVFILLYTLVFGLTAWQNAAPGEEQNGQILAALLNTAMPFLLLFGLSLAAAQDSIGGLHLALAVVFLALAQAFWIRAAARYATFFYTMAGNLALSVAIFSTFNIPSAFLWLCLQSFLVISLAIWFRSRFIVVANFGIFISILIAYLVMAHEIDATLMVFGIVALLSARIMNWQKDRLELKADMLRNSYLVTALFVIPWALHHILPGVWVSLSWAGVALAYYGLSKILDNFKYRWMAIATLLMAVLHVMIIGTTSFEPTYRIVSFIVLGVVLLGVSLWYYKTTGKSSPEEVEG